jgi:SRSO17 transposase
MVRRNGSARWALSIYLARKLAHRRASLDRRAQVLPVQPAADTPLTQLVGAIKARWVCEQAHQQLKEELGLDHFEGRSWTGLHRHALMTMIAYAFLQARRLERASREKKKRRATPSTQSPGNPRYHHRRTRPTTTNEMPALP